MQKICKQCRQEFSVSKRDLAYYEKASPVIAGVRQSLPPPTLCPDCRQQRRLSFRNERTFYHRKCDLTGKQIIAIYSPETPFKVFAQEEWWGDSWNPLDYGRDIDFLRPFFAQWKELRDSVPRPSLFGKSNENSFYTNHTDHAKNCYLCVDTGFSENVYFSKYIINAKDLVDCYMTSRSERCYEALYMEGYNCTFTQLCEGVSDSSFLYNCKGCHNCFLCWNLQNKSYCILNQQYTKEEYEAKMSEVNLGKYSHLERYKSIFAQALLQAVRKASWIVNSEDCSGGSLHNCKSVLDSYDVGNSRDCSFCYDCDGLVDCYDTYESAFECELQYECHACNRGKSIISCSVSYDVHDVHYSDICHNSSDLFGCVGLRRAKYCILNRQYTKEEYERLVTKLIEHMQKTSEWCEFFPMELSPFAYNETIAQEYFPLTETEVLKKMGLKWQEEEATAKNYLGPEVEIPDDIRDIDDSICGKILLCKATGKPYKIIPQELQFYRSMNLPIPRKCPDQRHRERMALCNPRRLWKRNCMKCVTEIESTYSPDRKEIVYCERCYLETVY